MRMGAGFQAWGFVGSGVKVEGFQSLQEAVMWASQHGEWVVYERATMGWRPVRHGGERGRIVAEALPEVAFEPPRETVAAAQGLMDGDGLAALKRRLP